MADWLRAGRDYLGDGYFNHDYERDVQDPKPLGTHKEARLHQPAIGSQIAAAVDDDQRAQRTGSRVDQIRRSG